MRISRFLPACVRRKQAQHISSPSRTGGGVFGRCRCAPRPDALGWPSPSPRRSHLLARRRTARDYLNGIRRARAAFMLSRHKLSHRAFFPACTCGLRCRGLWRCVVVVSSRASESVVVCTCVFRTDLYVSVSFVLVAMRTIHGTLKRLLCALYYRYRTCCVVHAGRRCAPSCVDADKTWSITGALGVMAAALPARAGLRYLLTAVRQALKDRSSWLRQTRTFSEGSPTP